MARIAQGERQGEVTTNSVVQRRTPQEIVVTAKQVVILLKLFRDRWQDIQNSRWSQTTLALTRGWHFEDRCAVFAQALTRDPESSKYGESSEVTVTRRYRLEQILAEEGDDGGLGAYY